MDDFEVIDCQMTDVQELLQHPTTEIVVKTYRDDGSENMSFIHVPCGVICDVVLQIRNGQLCAVAASKTDAQPSSPVQAATDRKPTQLEVRLRRFHAQFRAREQNPQGIGVKALVAFLETMTAEVEQAASNGRRLDRVERQVVNDLHALLARSSIWTKAMCGKKNSDGLTARDVAGQLALLTRALTAL